MVCNRLKGDPFGKMLLDECPNLGGDLLVGILNLTGGLCAQGSDLLLGPLENSLS